jgi:hypothetical protein
MSGAWHFLIWLVSAVVVFGSLAGIIYSAWDDATKGTPRREERQRRRKERQRTEVEEAQMVLDYFARRKDNR